MFLRNCWYVAGWSHHIGADSLLSRTMLGEPIVLYRKPDGGVVALESRPTKSDGIHGSGKQITVCATSFRKVAAGAIRVFSPPMTIENRPCGITTAGAPLA